MIASPATTPSARKSLANLDGIWPTIGLSGRRRGSNEKVAIADPHGRLHQPSSTALVRYSLGEKSRSATRCSDPLACAFEAVVVRPEVASPP